MPIFWEIPKDVAEEMERDGRESNKIILNIHNVYANGWRNLRPVTLRKCKGILQDAFKQIHEAIMEDTAMTQKEWQERMYKDESEG